MYLSDKDIKEKLQELKFECPNDVHPFDQMVQIQPCSIDLRLDRIFWKTKKSTKSIDLRKSKLLEASPRRFWQKKVLNDSEFIVLKPGEFILGRTYEIFTIPNDCAGKLEGKSSNARLGLATQIGYDFINPGWRGNMPVQLVNYTRTSIHIFPYIPICQLILIKLTSIPERLYGADGLESKYMQDDGGPSYWWRDKRIKHLQELFYQRELSLKIQEDILATLTNSDPDMIKRFEKYYSTLKKEKIESAEWVLEKFARKEKWASRKEDFLLRETIVFMGGATINSLRYFFPSNNASWLEKIMFWSINLVLAVIFIYTFFFYNKKTFYTQFKK